MVMLDTCGSFGAVCDDAEANVVGGGAEEGDVWIAGMSGVSLNMSWRKSYWLSIWAGSGFRRLKRRIQQDHSPWSSHPVPLSNLPPCPPSPSDPPAIPVHQETPPPPSTRCCRRSRCRWRHPHSAVRPAAMAILRHQNRRSVPRCPSSFSDCRCSTRDIRTLVAPRRNGDKPGSSRRI